ncbi:unnamed protein product, partial [Rotaria sordida]
RLFSKISSISFFIVSNSLLTTLQYNSNTTASASSATTAIPRISFDIDQFGKLLSNYIEDCIQHLKKMCDRRILLAKARMEEYKALEDFEKVSTASHKIIHLVVKKKNEDMVY